MYTKSVLGLVAATLAFSNVAFAAPACKNRRISSCGPESRQAVSMPVRHSRRTSPTKRDLSTSLSNQIAAYEIELDIGTPAQKNTIQLDTGSSDIWVLTPSACGDKCDSGSFDTSKSSSNKANPSLGDFSISYFDGSSVNGKVYTDTISVSGSAVTNVTFAVVDDASSSNGNGIMGIGLPGLSEIQGQPSIINQMVEQNIIKSHAYSLYLDDLDSSTGAILFGGRDPSKYKGDLIELPIASVSDGAARLAVSLTGLSVKSGQSNDINANFPAVLDSGYTLSVLPDNVFSQVASQMNAKPYNGDNSTYTVDCNQPDGSVDFTFSDSGKSVTISVPFGELALPFDLSADGVNDKSMCRLGFINASTGGGNGVISFGDTFLRSAYMLYNFDSKTISLAQASYDSSCNNCMVEI